MDSNNPPKSSTIEDKLKLILHKLWKEDGDWKPAIEEIQAIITTETTNARIETAEEMERIALKAATRTPKDTLDVMVAIEKYVKDLQKEQP